MISSGLGSVWIDPRLNAQFEDFTQLVRAHPGVGTAAAIVVDRDALACVLLSSIRCGVFAGKLLTVEVVALVSPITERFSAGSPTATKGIRRWSLDPGALVI